MGRFEPGPKRNLKRNQRRSSMHRGLTNWPYLSSKLNFEKATWHPNQKEPLASFLKSFLMSLDKIPENALRLGYGMVLILLSNFTGITFLN